MFCMHTLITLKVVHFQYPVWLWRKRLVAVTIPRRQRDAAQATSLRYWINTEEGKGNFNIVQHITGMCMSLNGVAPWIWLQVVAETCRTAVINTGAICWYVTSNHSGKPTTCFSTSEMWWIFQLFSCHHSYRKQLDLLSSTPLIK
jgi:hypothetical protein